jgi:hypothetical protein
MGQLFFRSVGFCALLACAGMTYAKDGALILTYSFDSLKGNFGQAQETKVQTVAVKATVIEDMYRVAVFVPYVSLEGRGHLVGGTVVGSSAQATHHTKGMGDVVATASVDLLGGLQDDGFSMAATGVLKLPTADEGQGLGTGKTDLGLQLDLAYRFESGFGLTGSVGHQFYGRTTALPLKDGNYQMIGLNFKVTDAFYVNLNVKRSDPLLEGGAGRRESSISGVYALSPTSAFQLSLAHGGSSASPDDSLSASLVFQQ